jgi:hypothetical protein
LELTVEMLDNNLSHVLCFEVFALLFIEFRDHLDDGGRTEITIFLPVAVLGIELPVRR